MAWSIHQWKGYFATAPDNASALEILQHDIAVAAIESPQEFNLRKALILESIEEATTNVGTKIRGDSAATVVENAPRKPYVIRIKLPKSCLNEEKKPGFAESVVVDQKHEMVKAKKAVLDEEATKRKLQERYEEIEKNKKQKRVVQLNRLVSC